jgi:GT2 family glycosyltransferase
LPQLSVVIPVYDNWWLTARCLHELDRVRNVGAPSFETIVVDNASSDETGEAIAGFPWARYLRLKRNCNFAGACNAGARQAEAPLLLLLNNDAYPLGDAFSPLVRVFERADVAIAGGALFFEDGVTQAAGLVVLPNAHWHYSCRNLPPTLGEVVTPRDAIGISGAAMAVRTQWFLSVGGFDESFVNGFEDVDLCMRAREAGRAIAYVAEARFAHYEAASAGRFDREAENERRFYQRWSERFAAIPRVARGAVGAIAVRRPPNLDPLSSAALDDLEAALRSFGHPVERAAIRPWRRFDRRFRESATLEWFTGGLSRPGVAVGRPDSCAEIRTHGAVDVRVPWMPCAASERIASLGVRRSDDASCNLVGVVGSDEELRGFRLPAEGFRTLRITPQMLLGGDAPVGLVCAVHVGVADESAFGNVLLAQAGVPAIVLANDELRALFSSDVALITERDGIPECAVRLIGDPSARTRYGMRLSADARRRFSPRRTAIRVVDLLCAARFGLERPSIARSNSPVTAAAGGLDR